MIIEDFVFLGTTVPERISDGRVVVCSAGYSHERRSLVRVYPLPVGCGVRRWDRFEVPLEINGDDSRPESYKVRSPHRRTDLDRVMEALTHRGHVREQDRLADVDRYRAPSIAWCNAQRHSLAIIEPHELEWTFEYERQSDPAVLRLPLDGVTTEEQKRWGRRSFAKRPRLQFLDEDGRHDLALNEWGAFEWLRKHPGQPGRLFDNLRFGASDREARLLVGNFAHHRTSWCVIAYLSFKRTGAMALPLDGVGVVS